MCEPPLSTSAAWCSGQNTCSLMAFTPGALRLGLRVRPSRFMVHRSQRHRQPLSPAWIKEFLWPGMLVGHVWIRRRCSRSRTCRAVTHLQEQPSSEGSGWMFSRPATGNMQDCFSPSPHPPFSLLLHWFILFFLFSSSFLSIPYTSLSLPFPLNAEQ